MLRVSVVIRHLICIGMCVASSACASTQLNYNTADLASSLNSLAKKQIFYNLAQALEDHVREHVARPGLDAAARAAGAEELIAVVRRYAK